MKLALALALTTCATALELQSLTQFLKQTDTAAGLTAVTAAALAGGAASRVAGGAPPKKRLLEAPYIAGPGTYDPLLAEEFYGARPLLVASRLLTLGRLTFGFNSKLLMDFAAYKSRGSPEGEPWPNEAARAKEALTLSTQLGPTFIKLAQALSIRTDLIPEVLVPPSLSIYNDRPSRAESPSLQANHAKPLSVSLQRTITAQKHRVNPRITAGLPPCV